MGALNREEVRYWTSHIRDIIATQVAWGGEDVISSVTIDKVHRFLAGLREMKVDIEMLKYSHVHKALVEMTSLSSGWSPAVMLKAEMVLLVWEEELGSVRELGADLWDKGGRLEGLKKFEDLTQDVRRRVESETLIKKISRKLPKHYAPSWEINYGEERVDAYFSGHIGFAVGSWWIKAAAAHRDGIICGLTHGITAGELIAYAIVMTDDEEIDLRDENHFQYRPSVMDPNRLKLIWNMTTKNSVRVLRTARLKSIWKTQAGIRYDGLYKVTGFGVRLGVGPDHKDSWSYTFDLQRELSQVCMEEVMSHPNAAEMDDWNDFQKDVSALVQSRQLWGGIDNLATRENQDSGYTSRTVSWLMS